MNDILKLLPIYFPAAFNADVLRKLNIDIGTLPQRSQHILRQTADNLYSLKIDQLDSTAISLQHSRLEVERMEGEYEILKVKQKNAELQMKIDSNKMFLNGLRRDLECSKEFLASQTPNPENIREHFRQLKLKVATYEENYEKAMAKFNKLSVPPHLYPKSLLTLASTLATLRAEAETLRQRADDVLLAREARSTINRLRR
ncbi:unnamed protein product [Diatraea saccharalis]|uniref:Uncharacterized protein n=1 Tax=Diatraea saccharalis TaxID=40085 RepID=A0A9N9RDR8_9NEOP|nr:unnamed protein product [Diatraea saccharalis]